MADRLPDETLAAILAESVVVPDASFAATMADKSPFAEIAHSSSTILLVCKRWMRVATPLVYETVILRSVAQSRALAEVLKEKPQLGCYVRKFRVEGGVGASICKIFKAAPRITDLCLTIDLYADDKAVHMYTSLFDSVAPRRLVLCSGINGLKRNKLTTAAIDVLVTCISQWASLRVVTVADVILDDRRLYDAICGAKQLQVISIPQRSSFYYAVHGKALSDLAAECAAPVIRVGWPAQGYDLMLHPRDRFAELSLVAQEKVVFADPVPTKYKTVVAPPSTLSYKPLANACESIRRTILAHIFEAVIANTDGIDTDRLAENIGQVYDGGSGSDEGLPSDPFSKLPRGPVGQCMSVCKEWKDIITPLACRHLYFLTPEKAVSFTNMISGRTDASDLVAAVRTINFHTDLKAARLDRLANLCDTSFLSQFHSLEELHGANVLISSTALRTLPTTHLRSLTINSDCGRFDVRSFPTLRALNWTLARFHSVVKASPMDLSQSMPALETLVVAGDGAPKILICLSNFSLPALTSLTFDDKVSNHDSALQLFCAANGASIREVFNKSTSGMLSILLPTCPGLTNVSVSCAHLSKLAQGFRHHVIPHTSLKEITCPPISIHQRYNKHKAHEMQLLTEFCDALIPARLPALRTVRISSDNFWPNAQRDIANHPLPVLAERLLARGLRIVNAKGVGWKPRLR
ncbi:hypothetical protein AURDEDRAFT_175902 [Auricularia subglabra TFB-10046 SS5]|uniref:Uncharacterized protein n=1 Tax=Auricularia subglabra (strain TFB-10046 / SS5) TaxID=717982 RepID=J0LE13_AURST|nr:hypothetical protein AURDEDRAFT_175902 [Auricularia subglabra TFB-10046 SS5]